MAGGVEMPIQSPEGAAEYSPGCKPRERGRKGSKPHKGGACFREMLSGGHAEKPIPAPMTMEDADTN
jgi:hypothetical protein